MNLRFFAYTEFEVTHLKLAVITDEIDSDLGHALDVMAEYGVQGAELRQLWDKNIAEAPR